MGFLKRMHVGEDDIGKILKIFVPGQGVWTLSWGQTDTMKSFKQVVAGSLQHGVHKGSVPDQLHCTVL